MLYEIHYKFTIFLFQAKGKRMSFIAAKSFALDGSRSSSLEKRHKIKSPNHATQESSGSIFRFTSNELNRMK